MNLILKSVLFTLTLWLVSCAQTKTETTQSPLYGKWTFADDLTEKHIQDVKNWPSETTKQAMKAYPTHEYSFSHTDYLLTVRDQRIIGTYTLTPISNNTYKVDFSCPKLRKKERGTITLNNNLLFYRSDSPLIDGAAEIYRKKG